MYFNKLAAQLLEEEIQKPVSRYDQCVNSFGNFVEKWARLCSTFNNKIFFMYSPGTILMQGRVESFTIWWEILTLTKSAIKRFRFTTNSKTLSINSNILSIKYYALLSTIQKSNNVGNLERNQSSHEIKDAEDAQCLP